MRLEDSVCNICDHNIGDSRCGCDNSNWCQVQYPDDCDDFEYMDEDDDDDDDDDDGDDESIECPQCGSDAYWNGSNYECEDCGWCGQ